MGMVLSCACGSLATPASTVGQSATEPAPLYLGVSPDHGSLQLRIGSLFTADEELAEALHSGLPLRILLIGELWKDGFFDSQVARGEWRASVVYDPLGRRYRVNTAGRGRPEIAVDSLPLVEDVLEEEFSLSVRPRERGRYYYLVRIEIETLSLADLEELQRWLRGELGSAATGEESGESAVGRGVREVLVKMLGLPAKRFRLRSASFEFRSSR